ncbi:hypothetical protein K5549_003403 [Capra hircus]|uniref:Small ribosomal subunit protein uS15 n=1 Tax=Capra hircus TaxID=9925 RepID=A0A452EP99_CAPHI|nr:hypothetical protein K5549_003403 [Capra hircus]
MGRVHAPWKGLSPRHRVPTRLKLTPEDMKEQTYKVVKKSLTPSRIGVVLRDSHSSKGLAPDFPEDLYHLIKKAVAVQKHPERKRKDKDAQLHLILIESPGCYKTKQVLPLNRKYESSAAFGLIA